MSDPAERMGTKAPAVARLENVLFCSVLQRQILARIGADVSSRPQRQQRLSIGI